MNKWFNRLEYGKWLVNAEQLRYSDNDVYMMAGYLIWSEHLTADEAWDIISNKLQAVYTLPTLIGRQKRFSAAMTRAMEKEYTDISPIQIRQKEIDTIATISSATQRRVLFTLLCFAKYNTMVNPENNGWVNFNDTMIKRSSGIYMSTIEYNEILFRLKEQGMIINSRKVTSNNMQVPWIANDGEIVYELADLRGLGDVYVYHWGQYLPSENNHRVFKGILKYCCKCGAPFLDKSSHHNRMICSQCKL